MFMSDANKKDEIRSIALQDLKKLGVKFRCKKSRQHVQETRSRKVFKVPLRSLPMETVTLPSGQQLVVPKIVHELCSYIVTKIDTEGLFRKGGSKSRQNEIRLSLDAGCYLGDEHHEIDVASVLKTFFRELPEPLVPYVYHELFLRCMLLKERQTEAVLLSCLLLPMEHLNTLTYFLQFLLRVSDYMKFNKMDAYNLAVVIGPTLLPAEEKLPNNATYRLTKTCELFKLLIENAGQVGLIPENVIERIPSGNSSLAHSDDDTAAVKKKKKRRSGSLTRMLSGLKKIVSAKSEDGLLAVTPDLLQTPCLNHSTKKRKLENTGLSTKKRKNILNSVPNNAVLSTPIAPLRTPVHSHPNGKKKCSPKSPQKSTGKPSTAKEKRLLWSTRTKTSKKQNDETSSIASVESNSIQRRWSAVSSVAGFRRKKTRNSCAGTIEGNPQIENRLNDLSEEIRKEPSTEEPSYVKISKTEYEEIKNRVSAIERCISVELDKVQDESPGVGLEKRAENVEKAYERTLVQSEPLSPTTDQLAKRLSRELKIRRSSDSKVIRSPSARKIGSLRKRSKERMQVRLNRNQTWCITTAAHRPVVNRALVELPNPPSSCNIVSTPTKARANSFNSGHHMSTSLSSDNSTVSWKSAQDFPCTPDTMSPATADNCRASLAKLRSQNAGMVLARARLFDNLGGSEKSSDHHVKPSQIGSVRTLDNRQSCRVRALREERRTKRMTPKKKSKSPGNKLLRIQCNSDDMTMSRKSMSPKNIPVIKKSLNPRSPRKICCTPVSVDSRKTPLKALPHRY